MSCELLHLQLMLRMTVCVRASREVRQIAAKRLQVNDNFIPSRVAGSKCTSLNQSNIL